MKKFVVLVFALILCIGSAVSEQPLIKNGDYNKDVIKLHQKLSDLGYFELRPESPWGPDSEWALKVLQWNMDWEQTGLVENQEMLDEILALEKVIGKNLLLDSDYYIEKDSESSLVETKIFPASYPNLQELIGKKLTLSIYLNSPGERGTSVEDPENYMANRFGVHGGVVWGDSTGSRENKNIFWGTNLLTRTVDDNRISSTFKLTAPEGYDAIISISAAVQAGARPIGEVWALGYPKLEIGNKATEWENSNDF